MLALVHESRQTDFLLNAKTVPRIVFCQKLSLAALVNF